MTEGIYHITQPERPFARTNRQTIQQRAQILQELGYKQPSIAEICCGDCQRQQRICSEVLQTETYCGLDMSPTVVALNRVKGVDCVQGDALDVTAMRQFATFDVLFFGPPLSEQCDGHTGLPFSAIRPGFAPFARLLLEELSFMGLLVCICPNSTNLGDAQWLYRQIQAYRADIGLRLIHHSYTTLTGADEVTEMRLKYVELWFSARLADLWEVRKSWGESLP
jgi:hypothetical protein